MKIMKKVSISFILLLESLDLWTSSCFSILFLLYALYPSKFWQKVWTGGQEIKISEKKFQPNMFPSLKSVDMWTRCCLSISFFLSFFLSCTLYFLLQKVWTGGQVLKILKKVSIPLISFLKSVDMWTKSCLSNSFFLSFFFLVPFIFLQKCVDRWTSNENSEKR